MAPAELVHRFGRTERAVHWLHAGAFFALTLTGLLLLVPQLSALVPNRPVVKGVHLVVSVLWLAGLAAAWIAGDRTALRRTRRELERFTPDDLAWLRGRSRPQGRFNAGQKAHAVVQAAFAVLFTGSGVLLWLGEREAGLRTQGAVVVHDGTMVLAGVLVLGHLVLALAWPSTRPALRGIVRGTVDRAWAGVHHASWRPGPAPGPRVLPPSAAALLSAVLIAAGAASVALVLDARAPAAPEAAAAAAGPDADVLAERARALEGEDRLDDALTPWASAVAAAPRRADLHRGFGVALARTGRLADGIAELRRARELDPAVAEVAIELAVALQADGQAAEAREAAQAYLAGAVSEEGRAAAEALLAPAP